MIIKSMSRKTHRSTGAVPNYIYRNADLNDPRSFVYKWNVFGRTPEAWIQQFRENLTYRQRRDLSGRANKVLHEVISWHAKDAPHITPEVMRTVLDEYARTRSRGRSMFVAIPHFDKEHVHIHLAVSSLEFRTGRSARMDRSDYRTFKQNLQELEIHFPDIQYSLVDHMQPTKRGQRITDAEYHYKNRTGKATKKDLLIDSIKQIHQQSISLDDFLKRLNDSGLKPYYRGGRLSGIKTETGRSFRFSTLGLQEQVIELQQRYSEPDISGNDNQDVSSERVKQRLTELAEIREQSQVHDLERNIQGNDQYFG